MNKSFEKYSDGRRQLFLFHFAGGSSYSFDFMRPFLTEFEILPLELPGRGNRIREKLIENFEDAANDFVNRILRLLKGGNFVFYGHSLGALFAFRVCQLLENRNILPQYIVVSGNAGPGIALDKDLNELEKEDFISELIKLGGIPAEIAEEPEIIDFFLPILRADFEMANKETFKIEGGINTPIYALMGNEEETSNEIENWKNYTIGDFQSRIVKGNHFFIYEQVETVATAIKLFKAASVNDRRSNKSI